MSGLNPSGLGSNKTFNNTEAESVNTGSAIIGAAEEVLTGPIGDSGDWVPVLTYKPAQSPITTTSTSYTRVESNDQSAFIPLNTVTQIANFVDVGLNIAGFASSDTVGEDVTISAGYDFNRLGNTEVAVTGTNPNRFESEIQSISDLSEGRTNIFMKVSGGEGSLESNHTTTVWGKKP